MTLSAVSNVCSCDSKKESAVNSSSVNLSPDVAGGGGGGGSICVEDESFTIGDNIPHSSNNCPKSTDIKYTFLYNRFKFLLIFFVFQIYRVITNQIHELTTRIDNLESTLKKDVRTILDILHQQQQVQMQIQMVRNL